MSGSDVVDAAGLPLQKDEAELGWAKEISMRSFLPLIFIFCLMGGQMKGKKGSNYSERSIKASLNERRSANTGSLRGFSKGVHAYLNHFLRHHQQGKRVKGNGYEARMLCGEGIGGC